MVRPELIRYVQGLLQRNYSDQAIRSYLAQAGYTAREIDEAFSASRGPVARLFSSVSIPRVPPVPSHRTLFISIGAVVIILIALTAFLSFRGPSRLLDVSIVPQSVEVYAGDRASFALNLLNVGRDKTSFDVTARYELQSPTTGNVVTSKEETFALSTTKAQQNSITIPSDLEQGRYVVRARVTYESNKVADAGYSLLVLKKRISSSPPVPPITPPENQTPGQVPPVTPPATPPSGGCVLSCEDFDPCTVDSCVSGECVNTQQAVCCGDGACSGGETASTCASDCAPRNTGKNAEEVTTEAEASARAGNDERANALCATLLKTSDADICYARVADASEDWNICKSIREESKRDTCLMDFALSKNQFEVCEHLSNRYLKNSCFSLKTLRELQMQRAQQSPQE